MREKVTIGICVKNSEKIVEQALQSISGQSFPHKLIRLIVVDDGSTDRTYYVAKDMTGQMDIKTDIYRSGGKGLSFSRQLVVDNAQGEYVIWVDGDQELLSDFVQKHVEFMEKNPTVAVACGKEVSRGKTLVARLESMSIATKNLKSQFTVDVGGGIFRLEAVREIGGFDIRLKGAGEDVELTNRIKKAGMKVVGNEAKFFHNHRATWKALWEEYSWWGYGMHYVNHRHEHAHFPMSRMPILSFFVGLKLSSSMYTLFHEKKVFLLPFQYFIKNLAFCIGYAESHLDKHGD